MRAFFLFFERRKLLGLKQRNERDGVELMRKKKKKKGEWWVEIYPRYPYCCSVNLSYLYLVISAEREIEEDRD